MLQTPAGERHFDAVISTVPLPLVAPMLAAGGADPALVTLYANQISVACACVVLHTNKPITGNFWTNINDARFAIPGIIEFSNLRPLQGHIAYVPYYMPATHPKWGWNDAQFVTESMDVLRRLNPLLTEVDLKASTVGRLRHAQPVCEPGFAAKIPPTKSPIAGLWIADTCFYYPEDRGISESVRLGAEMAAEIKDMRRS